MRHLTARHRRALFFGGYLLLATSVGIAVHVSRPWLRLHQENLVAHDCRLNSEAVPIGSKYPGRIKELCVEIGQQVEPGDVVARLDTKQLEAEFAKARAAMELARAELAAEELAIEKASAAMNAQQQCLKAEVSVSSSRSTAIQLETRWIEKELARSKQLAKRGSFPIADLEKILRELQAFKSKQKIADDEVLVAELDLTALAARFEEIQARSARLSGLKQKIQMAQSECDAIGERQSAATIKANNSGTVIDIVRGAGSSVRVGDSIMQIQQDYIWSEVWVDESRLGEIAMGADATINLKAFPGMELKGKVVCFLTSTGAVERSPQFSENPMLQPDSKVCLKIKLESHSHELLPGLTGTAVIKKTDQNVDYMHDREQRIWAKWMQPNPGH